MIAIMIMIPTMIIMIRSRRCASGYQQPNTLYPPPHNGNNNDNNTNTNDNNDNTNDHDNSNNDTNNDNHDPESPMRIRLPAAKNFIPTVHDISLN